MVRIQYKQFNQTRPLLFTETAGGNSKSRYGLEAYAQRQAAARHAIPVMKHQRRKKGSERGVLVFHPLWKVAAVHYANLEHRKDDHGNHAHDPHEETLENVDEEQVCGVPGAEIIFKISIDCSFNQTTQATSALVFQPGHTAPRQEQQKRASWENYLQFTNPRHIISSHISLIKYNHDLKVKL